MIGAQFARDGVKLIVVSHGRSHDRPLVPEQPSCVGLDHRARCRSTTHQPATAPECLQRAAPRGLPDIVDDHIDARLGGRLSDARGYVVAIAAEYMIGTECFGTI